MSRVLTANDISEFGIALAEWVANPGNQKILSSCIILAQKTYESEYQARTHPLGNPAETDSDVVAQPTAVAPAAASAQSLGDQVAAFASATSTFTVWAATKVADEVCKKVQRVASATMTSITSNRIVEFHVAFPKINEENAWLAFLHAGQMPGWQVAGHTVGTGRASLNTLIVDGVVRTFMRSRPSATSASIAHAYENGDLTPRDIFIACNTATRANPALKKALDAKQPASKRDEPVFNPTSLLFGPGS